MVISTLIQRHVPEFLAQNHLLRPLEDDEPDEASDKRVARALRTSFGTVPRIEMLLKKGGDGMGIEKETEARTKSVIRLDFANPL